MKVLRGSPFERCPDAILFDTDNTLYPYDPAHRAALNAVKEKFSTMFGTPAYVFDTALSRAKTEIKERLGNTASSHSRLLYMQRVLELLGLGSQVLMALDFEQTYWRTFLANARLHEGVLDLLEEFRLRKIPLVIITDLTAQIQFRKVVYFGLDHYFDYIVTSEEVGADKPHAATFQLALQKLNLPSANVWMIGDNFECDIVGAKRAIDATTFFFRTSEVNISQSEFSTVDVEFRNFNHLLCKVRRMADVLVQD